MDGSCHCGGVRWSLGAAPETLTRCNCSYCRRVGALWAYGTRGTVKLDFAPDAVTRYSHGDRTLTFVRCSTCGCTTHWVGTGPGREGPDARMAVNAMMAEPDAIAGIRIRHFDGADSWTFLD